MLDVGDVALVPDPAFPIYPAATWLAGADVRLLPLSEEAGFLPDFEAIRPGDVKLARLLFLNYPNNPTSAVADTDFFESVVAFAGGGEKFIIQSESPTDVPNYYLATLGKKIKAAEGEATRQMDLVPVTNFEDPTPELRQIEKRLVQYEREDGVPLSFQLLLPPGYQEGTALPTVVYAYPLEYSDPSTAGQVRGSAQRFSRFYGSSHLFFLLRGYAVLDRTAMPMVGDPETTYDTFVPQLVADAEAAVAKAVEMRVADPERIGVIGHSHGGLMVANLLAHSDLFRAGIARSGSYNKTMQPFGFQSERRSLFEARDVYIQVSPTFFADQVNEPVLIIHGNADSNPGTLTFQSEVFFEAVRGSGGIARLVLLVVINVERRAVIVFRVEEIVVLVPGDGRECERVHLVVDACTERQDVRIVVVAKRLIGVGIPFTAGFFSASQSAKKRFRCLIATEVSTSRRLQLLSQGWVHT